MNTETIKKIFESIRGYFPELELITLVTTKQGLSFSNETVELSLDKKGNIVEVTSKALMD